MVAQTSEIAVRSILVWDMFEVESTEFLAGLDVRGKEDSIII